MVAGGFIIPTYKKLPVLLTLQLLVPLYYISALEACQVFDLIFSSMHCINFVKGCIP